MRTRRWLVLAVTFAAMLVAPATAYAGQSFLFLQPGFTQSIFGVTTTFMGGVAFAPNGDPWVDECFPDGAPMTRFDASSTYVANGTTLHPGTTSPSSAGCGLTNGANGNLYTNTTSGVRELDPNTGAPIGGPFGPGGSGLGIAPDPQTGDLVYVDFTGTLYKVDEGLTTSSTFSTVTTGNFIDGIRLVSGRELPVPLEPASELPSDDPRSQRQPRPARSDDERAGRDLVPRDVAGVRRHQQQRRNDDAVRLPER